MLRTHVPDGWQIKEAAGGVSSALIPLGPRADRWATDALNQILLQHPYLTQYRLSAELKAHDEERGYGLGTLKVVKPSDSRFADPACRIPFLIADGKLHPVRVFLDATGRADVLRKEIFAEAMFEEGVGDSLAMPVEGSPSLFRSLYPPDRNTYGFGTGFTQTGTFKTSAARSVDEGVASKHAEVELCKLAESSYSPDQGPWLGHEAEVALLVAGQRLTKREREQFHKKAMATILTRGKGNVMEKVAHTLTRADQEAFASALGRDMEATRVLEKRAGVSLWSHLMIDPPALPPRADQALLVEALGGASYLLKTATADPFDPISEVVGLQELKALSGEDLVRRVDEAGRVTVTTTPAKQETLDDVQVGPIDEYGFYKVQQLESGRHVLGMVITNVITLDMVAVPMKLFTNGSEYAYQAEVVGVRVGSGQGLPYRPPQPGDLGVFFYISPSTGAVTCTIPLTITHTETVNEKSRLAVVDTFGQTYRLGYAPGQKVILQTGDGSNGGIKEYMIPNTMSWMPLSKETRLVPDAMLFSKTASALSGAAYELVSLGSSYQLRGEGIAKCASLAHRALSSEEAAMALTAAGIAPDLLREKMAECKKKGKATMRGKALVGRPEKRAMVEAIGQRMAALNASTVRALKRDTVKLAAALPPSSSPDTIDAILSLNFINDENVHLYVDAYADFENARRDLAQLYLAVEIGLPDVPLAAVGRAMDALVDVCAGLRKVKMRTLAL